MVPARAELNYLEIDGWTLADVSSKNLHITCLGKDVLIPHSDASVIMRARLRHSLSQPLPRRSDSKTYIIGPLRKLRSQYLTKEILINWSDDPLFPWNNTLDVRTESQVRSEKVYVRRGNVWHVNA
jgi:hypothetical protein